MVNSNIWAALATGLMQGAGSGYQMGTAVRERRLDRERDDSRDQRALERDLLQLRMQAAKNRGAMDLDPLWTAREKIGGDRRSVEFARSRFYDPAGGDAEKASSLAKAEEEAIRTRMQGLLGPEGAASFENLVGPDGEIDAAGLLGLFSGTDSAEARQKANAVRLEYDALRSTRESAALFDWMRYNPQGMQPGGYDAMADVDAYAQRWGAGGVPSPVGSAAAPVPEDPRMPGAGAAPAVGGGGPSAPQLWSNDLGELVAGTPPAARRGGRNPAPPMPAFRQQQQPSVMEIAEQYGDEARRAALGPGATAADYERSGNAATLFAVALNPQAPIELQAAAWTKLSKIAPVQIPVEHQVWANGAGVSEEDLLSDAQAILADAQFTPRDPMADRGAGPAGMMPPGRPLPGPAQGPASPEAHGQARGGTYMPPTAGMPPPVYSTMPGESAPRRGYDVQPARPTGFAGFTPSQVTEHRQGILGDAPAAAREATKGSPKSPSWDEQWSQLWQEARRMLGRDPTEQEMLRMMMAINPI